MRPRRALLFMPGDSERKIAKAAALGADAVVMDLEDGVAWSQKAAAREVVRRALQELAFGRSERVVRVNRAGSELAAADIQATLAGQPDAYMLPKVESPAHVRWLDDVLRQGEAAQGWPVGGMRMLLIIETALGVMNVQEIATVCAASRRGEALLFGAEDLIGDIGGVRTKSNLEVLYARSQVAIAAAAYGLQAIDQVYVDLQDDEGLRAECQQALELGYRGKMAIHPRQVGVIQTAFSPTAAQVAAAQHLIAAYQAHQAAGAGVFAWEGKMIDAPMLRAAEHVLARAALDTSVESAASLHTGEPDG